MTLVVKQLLRTTTLGTEVWITDNTLAYSASNTGGWGSPNPALNQTALVAYIKRTIPSGATGLVPLTAAVSYSASDTSDIQRSIGFTYLGDGHYTSYLWAIPVSSDGVTTLAGHTIVSGDIFVQGLLVYQKNSGAGSTQITSFSTIIDSVSPTIYQSRCDKMFYNKLAVKRNDEYYRQYRDARDANDPAEAADLLKKMEDLDVDIAGAEYRFRASLFTIAENIVDELLEKHEIV